MLSIFLGLVFTQPLVKPRPTISFTTKTTPVISQLTHKSCTPFSFGHSRPLELRCQPSYYLLFPRGSSKS